MNAMDYGISQALWVSDLVRRSRESRQLTTEEAMDLDVIVAGEEDCDTRL